MGVFAIGDIHGCAALLEELLAAIEERLEAEDRVVFLGDYIDRGPDSRDVIAQVIEFKERHRGRVVALLGNHEQWLRRLIADHRRLSWLLGMDGLSTIRSYSRAAHDAILTALKAQGPKLLTEKIIDPPIPIQAFVDALPESHLRFITEELEPMYQDEHIVAVHAGLDSKKSLEEQSEDDLVWNSPPRSMSRWAGSKTLVLGHLPTFCVAERHRGRPIIQERAVLLDTGSDKTGVLSAMRFPDRLLLQARGGER